MRRWLFLPIDDRPITYGFPRMLAPLGGIELVSPPRSLLGQFLTPGSPVALAAWLRENAAGCEGAILNLDMLAYGGLVASRTTQVPAAEALLRLDLVRSLKAMGLQVLAANVLMRLGITGSSREAAASHALIQRWSQAVADPARAAEALALEQEIPPAALDEYRGARARNLALSREAVQLVARGGIDFLLLLQEDCTPFGLHRLEQAELTAYIAATGTAGRVRLLPGTDEGSLLLLARAALQGRSPAMRPVFARESTAALPAPYEDRSLLETTALQIEASGARVATPNEEAASLLFVNTPVVRYGDMGEVEQPIDDTGEDYADVTDGSGHLVTAIQEALATGRSVAVADVAFANGADPRFTARLLAAADWSRLTGYAAWNTAGNTLGTAIAMAVLRGLGQPGQEQAHGRALLIRLLDDYVYQSAVRVRLNGWCRAQGYDTLHLGSAHPAASAWVQEAMRQQAGLVPGLRPGDIFSRLPWPRTFEVEVDLRS